MAVAKSKRIFYFDALRALAIFCVIVIHVYCEIQKGILPGYGIIPSYKWIYAQIMGNSFRIGVDLFLMLSGALSLGRVWDIKTFLGKRIPRIVAPFLFWGLILSLILIGLSYFMGYNYIKSFDLYSILNFIYKAYIAKGRCFAPYWFFWMILGTYFIMPILNKWLLHADLAEAEYFLILWLITCLFEFTLKMDFPITLTYFTGPIGFVVAGYYLRHTERKLLNNPYFALLLIILTSILMLGISWYFSSAEGVYNFNRYSFLTAVEAIGVFLLFKNFNKFGLELNFIKNQDSWFHKLVFLMAKNSYGMYLIHAAIISIILKSIPGFSSHTNVFTVVMLLAVVFISLGVMEILNKVPYLNQVIGSK